jgi:hypothetical protein
MGDWTVGDVLDLIYEQLDADETLELFKKLRDGLEPPSRGSRLIRGIRRYYADKINK